MAAKKETKREKFVRMAEARTIKIISMVRLLGNCSNRLALVLAKHFAFSIMMKLSVFTMKNR